MHLCDIYCSRKEYDAYQLNTQKNMIHKSVRYWLKIMIDIPSCNLHNLMVIVVSEQEAL